MTDDPEAADRLATRVAEAMPLIGARIPAGSAAEFGRLGARPAGARSAHTRPMPRPGYEEPLLLAALHELSPLLVERLLGALELTVPDLALADAWSPSFRPTGPLTGFFAYAGIVNGGESTAARTLSMIEQLRPGLSALALELARDLAGHPVIAPLLNSPTPPTPAAAAPGAMAPTAADEASIATAHGMAYLALAVAAASAVLGGVRVPQPPWGAGADPAAAAVVGVAAGVAALLLREAPMPAAYPAALLAKTRAEYRLPVQAGALITVTDHRFALIEGDFPAGPSDFSANGLVERGDRHHSPLVRRARPAARVLRVAARTGRRGRRRPGGDRRDRGPRLRGPALLGGHRPGRRRALHRLRAHGRRRRADRGRRRRLPHPARVMTRS